MFGNEALQLRDFFFHHWDQTGKVLLLILMEPDVAAVLPFQSIQFLQPRFDNHLAAELRIPGNGCGKTGIIQSAILVDFFHGSGTASLHGVVYEFLLAFQNGIHSGIQRLFDTIADDLHFLQNVALPDDPPIPLFNIRWPERAVNVVRNGQSFLNVDPGPQFCRGADHHPDFAGIDFFKQVGFLLVGIEIGDQRHFICRNPAQDQFAFQFIPGVENFAVPVKIAKYDLRSFDGFVFLVFFQNFSCAYAQLGIRIIVETVVDEARINRDFPAQSVNQKRNVGQIAFIGVTFIPFIFIAEIIHEFGNGRTSGNVDLFRMSAFDRRPVHLGQIFGKNHIGDCPEHFGKFDHIAVFAEPLYHLETTGSIQFQCRFGSAEYRSETVKRADPEFFQS